MYTVDFIVQRYIYKSVKHNIFFIFFCWRKRNVVKAD